MGLRFVRQIRRSDGVLGVTNPPVLPVPKDIIAGDVNEGPVRSA
jgi:hypothetical protein